MKPSRTLSLLMLALLVFCFGVAARLIPQFQAARWSRANGDIFSVVLGDSKRMFAQSFYVKADAYYHSGYYPSMFDNKEAFQTTHMATDTGAVNSQNHGDEEGFLGPKRNWIDAFGRHFYPDRHTHLDEGGANGELGSSDKVREILPWLKLSASLDPDNPQTYTVTAFWLRERMHKTAEAETFLHEGLRNNPDSFDILFELGRLYYESYHDAVRARNTWELAVTKWLKLEPEQKKENRLIFEQIATHLGQLESDGGNYAHAIDWFRAAEKASLTPSSLEILITNLQNKISAKQP